MVFDSIFGHFFMNFLIVEYDLDNYLVFYLFLRLMFGYSILYSFPIGPYFILSVVFSGGHHQTQWLMVGQCRTLVTDGEPTIGVNLFLQIF